MNAICLHDPQKIEHVLRRNVALHIYEIGDLDAFFWPYTTWYAQSESESSAIALLYSGMPLPVLIGLSEDKAALQKLLQAITHLLPRRFHAHLSIDGAEIFGHSYRVRSAGKYYKMSLGDTTRLETIDTTGVQPLTSADLPEIEAFYAASYPDNSFDPRMLKTGQFYSIRYEGQLASIAGIHVYSPGYRVAAPGNIATHPAFRGRGLAKRVSARLCRELLHTVDTIGLNVKADNDSAIACYQQLGFERVASYEECTCELVV